MKKYLIGSLFAFSILAQKPDYSTGLKNQPFYSDKNNSKVKTLADLCSQSAVLNATPVITEVWSNVTTQTLCSFVFKGGMIKPALNQIVTFTVQESNLTQICDITAGGYCNITGNNGEIYPQWWGALGDGSHDDTAAVQAALSTSSSGISVIVPGGRYLTSSLAVPEGGSLVCRSDATLLAALNNETMFTVPAGVNRISVYGSGGYCTLDANGKTGFQGFRIGSYGSIPSTNNTLRNIRIVSPSVGIETQETYFNLFENIRVTGPSVAAYQFETDTTATTCLNCSAIATTGTPYGFLIHNAGSITFNGTIEGTLINSVYQADSISFKVYFENTGSINSQWVQVGTQTGTTTQGISFTGCTFGVGAQYAVVVEQVQGLVVEGSYLGTSTAAFLIDNSASANGTKRGLAFSGNSYNIGGAGYDPTKILSFINATPGNDLSYNVSSDVSAPLKFAGATYPGGAVAIPPDDSMKAGEGTVYIDPTTGYLQYRYKTSGGTVTQGVAIGQDKVYFRPGDAGNPAQSLGYADAATGGLDGAELTGYGGVRLKNRSGTVAQFGGYYAGAYHDGDISLRGTSVTSTIAVNYIGVETGANNALVASLIDSQGNAVPVVAGLRITLRCSHSLQIGANTLNLNSAGPKPILKASNLSDITVAYNNGSVLDLFYDGASFQVLSQ